MNVSTDNVGAIVSALTVGVGGMVGWTKRSITKILKEAESVREQATAELDKINAQLTAITDEIAKVTNTAKVVAKKAPAKRAVAKKPVTK